MTGQGSNLPQQNIYVVADATQWPAQLDPHVLYNQTYEPGAGLYFYTPLLGRPLTLASELWVYAYSGITGYWAFDDTGQTAQDPTLGYVRINTVQASAATEVYIHETTATGADFSGLFTVAETGDTLSLENKTLGQTQFYSISGAPVDNGLWWTYPVTASLGSGGNWNQDDIIAVQIIKSFD